MCVAKLAGPELGIGYLVELDSKRVCFLVDILINAPFHIPKNTWRLNGRSQHFPTPLDVVDYHLPAAFAPFLRGGHMAWGQIQSLKIQETKFSKSNLMLCNHGVK